VWARVDTPQKVRDTGATDLSAILKVEGLPETIAAVAESIRLGLKNAMPQEVSIEFGLELHARTGKVVSVLAEAGGAATVKVQLTWDNAADGPAEARS
jgi:hypothetical protein